MISTSMDINSGSAPQMPSEPQLTGVKRIPKKKRTKSSSILLESTRQFCEKKRPTIEDISTYKAFFYQFIDTLPDTDKRQVAAVLARNPFTPRPIGLYLAMDRLEVAAPFLLFSPILKEMDLQAISRKMGAEYTSVIKRRDDSNKILGVDEANIESSTGILNDRVPFNNDVILDIEATDNSELIPNTISSNADKNSPAQMKKIPFDAKSTVDIRNEIAPAVGLARDNFDPHLDVDKTKEKTIAEPIATKIEFISGQEDTKDDAWLSSDEIVALASVGGKLGKNTNREISKKSSELGNRLPSKSVIGSSNKLKISTLIRQARAVDHVGFSQSVSKASGLDADQVLNIMHKKDGDELLYLIKALDVPAPKDLQLLLMLAPKHGRGIKMYTAAKKQFSELNVGVCRMIFNEVGANFEIPGAPKPVQIDGNRQDENFSHSVKMRRAHISAISRNEGGQEQQASFGKKLKAS